ncbi:protein Brevis radix-like 2 [Vicia villosa]|uniref:protein Brevis radix-like 2 n=1 Tax=Vicia villosa TaxID=3911 RepID=UPI00273A93C4|nr:protein Brevis radix-like 2 [Vicia villosa]
MHESSTKNRISAVSPLNEDSTDTTKSDNSLIEEVQRLKAEARRLEMQCELQNHETQEIQNKIEESWSVAKEEAAKCKAAKEVIQALTQRVSMLLKNDKLMDNNTNLTMPESQQDTVDILKAEWVERYEDGVYITLTTSPSGEKELKRMRFSRELFAKKDAERWWDENYAKVIHKYGIEGYKK